MILLIDAFHIFDRKSKGYITQADVTVICEAAAKALAHMKVLAPGLFSQIEWPVRRIDSKVDHVVLDCNKYARSLFRRLDRTHCKRVSLEEVYMLC